MIASTFFVIAAIAQAAFAQMISPPPGTPQCLIACSNQFCPTSEMSCICQQELQDITACVLTNCSGADLTAAESLAPRLCPVASSGSAPASASATPTTTGEASGSVTSGESPTSSVNSVSSASEALSSASSALSSASEVLSSASAASASGSSASASATAKSDGHRNAVGAVILCLAGVAAGFTLC